MIRGTTPTHIFEIPFDSSYLKRILITYFQDKHIVLEKTEQDCVLEAKSISTTLTQEDTLKFSHKKPVEIQIRVLTNDDTALATAIQEVDVGRVLNEEVLV